MERVYKRFGVMPRFEPSRQKFLCRDKPGIGEVEFDCYVFLDIGGIRHVWIAECELKREGNEARKTDAEKIKQLGDQLEAVESFEKERTHLPVQAKGYLVTNAIAMVPDASRIAQAHGIQFLSVKLPMDWTANMHWTLQEEAFVTCDI
jgi:hypothetical protein